MLAAVLLFLGGLGGCSWNVAPPPPPQRPMDVYLADYGRHTSIILPTGDGDLVEYAFGDWRHFALAQKQWYVGLQALFCSRGASLERRAVKSPGADDLLRQRLRAVQLVRFQAEPEKVAALAARLQTRYDRHADTAIFSERDDAYYARDDVHYSLWHNCNAETAQWLRELGCKVDGWPVVSNFRLKEPQSPQRMKPWDRE